MSAKLEAPAQPLISGLIQRKAERDANGVAAGADAAIASASSTSGMSLPAPIQRKFEASLGADLSSVRVHTGGESQAAASAVGAKAYTMGQDVHFGAGQYNPTSSAGEHLLAHEVAHTVQQQGGTPTRQNKLEVSAPQDAAEHEADRAADAMVSGGQASISGFSGVQRQVFRDVNPFQPTDGPSLFAPNTSKNGVPYTIPTVDYKGSVKPSAPSLDTEMPSASIPDPGAIPGWKVTTPAQERNLGPFKYTDPASETVIAGANHSVEMQDAWGQYKNGLVKNVGDAWDSGVRTKMNTYTQQAHSDPDLDKLLKDMHDNYRMTNIGQGQAGKKGTISQQADNTNINGQTASGIAGQIAGKGSQFQTDLAATEQAGQKGTEAGPVGAIVDKIKSARENTTSDIGLLSGAQGHLDAAADGLTSARAQVDIDDLNEKAEDEKKKKEEIENGQATLKKIDPELARLVGIVKENSSYIKTIAGMVKSGAKAMDGDPDAMLEVGKSVLEISKWSALAQCDANISAITDQVKAKYKLRNEAALTKAVKDVKTYADDAKNWAQKVHADLLAEKTLHSDLAKAVETNWKGKDKKDGQAAAQAIRALPIVHKVIATLQEIKGSLQLLPDSGTRESQGFALATQGVNAPGAAQLLTVAGWISGSPQAIDSDLAKWTGIAAQLATVTGGLGLT
ncbi:MAG TPA: DUF4157 domain-containing protein [Kofleriaceae bacterium]